MLSGVVIDLEPDEDVDLNDNVEVQRARALSGKLFLLAMKFLYSVKLILPSLSLSNFLKQALTCSGLRFWKAREKSFFVTKPSQSLSKAMKEAFTLFNALLIVSNFEILGGPWGLP